ncbi:hypothetical protein DYH09_30235, partial [bacterium CPR1]|nr:hypothetical protein [bacterium CPR1]
GDDQQGAAALGGHAAGGTNVSEKVSTTEREIEAAGGSVGVKVERRGAFAMQDGQGCQRLVHLADSVANFARSARRRPPFVWAGDRLLVGRNGERTL